MAMAAKITDPLAKKNGKYKNKNTAIVDFDVNFMWEKVQSILATDSKIKRKWRKLNKANKAMIAAGQQAAQMAVDWANNQELLQKDAMRMSLLLGAPLPEKAADEIVVGDNRFDIQPGERGRRSLRIEPTNPLAIS